MRIAIIQMTSTLDPKINLEKIQSFIDQAKQQMDIEAIFLPEVFYSMSNGQEPTPYLIEKNNIHYKNIQRLARDNAVFLLGATASTKDPNGGKIINRNYNFDPDGQELEYYDKMHS
jgi:predicted amidohydrolase